MAIPAATAASSPRARLPDRYAPTKPPHAPMRKMPSMAQIIIPVRSAYTSARAPSSRGVLIMIARVRRFNIAYTPAFLIRCFSLRFSI